MMQAGLELPISIPPRNSRERLRSLHRQLRTAILEGRLQPGLRLPPTRVLAAEYGVSRNTAIAAYDLLLSEGYLTSRRGAGTYVADVMPKPPARRNALATRSAVDRRLNAVWLQPAMPFDGERAPPRFHFNVGVPDISRFPVDVWRRLSARAMRGFAKMSADYDSPHGRPALRSAIARHVSFARAVACSADDVIVTAGAQQAFDLLARVLVVPKRTVVALENPGYPPLRAAFAAAGARIAAVPVDEEGLIVDRLPSNAKIVCVTPSHQFPLGAVMSAQRRAALLEFAHRRGAVVLEDDYDAEFRFGDRPLDALQTLDRCESVFYVGTFSKSLFPAIRLGFIVAPPWAQVALGAAKQVADGHCAVLAQETLAAFIAEGHLARHVRRMREIYAARRSVLLDGLQRDFATWLQPVQSAAGLHLTALAAALDLEAFVERARQRDVGISALRRFDSDSRAKKRPQGLVFGYGALDERGIVEGLARLRKVVP
jgi:GntR family transcriptional regulator / MocR family aminotransferase